MKLKFIYSTFICMLLCLTGYQIQAQITTTIVSDATWSAYSTPGRNLTPLSYNTINAGNWGTAVINQAPLNQCLTTPLTYPGTPIFSPGNDVCYDGGAAGVLTSYFKKDFTLNGGNNPLCSANVIFRADNTCRIYVDGTLVPGTNTTACGNWSYTNLSSWNWLNINTVNIMPFINLNMSTHTIIMEVGNCDYINYLADSIVINQAYPTYSPDFTISVDCFYGWTASVTPNFPAAANHVWQLFQTNTPGATSGGTLIATKTGPYPSFQWLDLSKFYYIVHCISVGCNQTVCATVEVPHLNNATLDYHFEDATGMTKDEFCVGEEVYLDPTGTTNYDRYLMILRKRPLGSTGPFGSDFNYGYTFTNNIGLLNLTDLFETAGYTFMPNTEYELQFVIQNIPNCIAWVELKKTFSIVCCNTTPDFNITINCDNGWGATAVPNSNIITNHVWQLFETTVPGATTGGTQVGSDQYGTTVNYQWLDQSKFYYIVHSISMPGCYGTLSSSVAIPTFASQANLTYQFKNVDGEVKSEFCVGEDIYLDPTGTSNYDRYFMAIRRRTIGGQYGSSAVYGFTFTNNIGLLNLSQLFQTIGVTFNPGFEYELQFAIQNPPNCIPWVELRKTFTVVCCDGFISPDFHMSLAESNSGISISVYNFKPYNSSISHSWTVLSSPNPNGGPYTLVTTTTTTGAGPHVIYTGGQSGLYYFVLHNVSSVCGDFCYIKRGEIFGAQEAGDPDFSTPCDLCGEVDCNILDQICFTPANLHITCNPSFGLIASWNPVQGATQYKLELTFNDPACCNNHLTPTIYTYTTTNAFQILGSMERRCFSYRVAALCEGVPQWSAPRCFTGCNESSSFGLAENTGAGTPDAQIAQARIFPNPANDEINIDLPLAAKADLVRMVDLQGKVVFEQHNPEQQLNINCSTFLAGMYAIQIIYEDGTISAENIVVTH